MRKENESGKRLLAKVNEVGEVVLFVEDIIRGLFEEYDYIPEIYIHHRKPEECSTLRITVHTSDTQSMEEYPGNHPSKVCIETENGQSTDEYNLRVMLTCEGGGHMEGAEGTTVYMEEYDVGGGDPRSLDEGISRLRKKFSGICPDCGSDVEDSYSHYPCRENMDSPPNRGDFE